ncbi:hypothetical protein BH11BAC1_BH11BAC1_30460 [soil metagenome]
MPIQIIGGQKIFFFLRIVNNLRTKTLTIKHILMKNSILKSSIANQLMGAGIALISVCLFSFIYPERNTHNPVGDEPGGGKSISAVEAKGMMANFPNWKPTIGQKGGYLSKKVFDAIFLANPNSTGIYWYLGTAVDGNELKLIVEPGVSILNGVNLENPSSIFMSETMCPTECGSLGRE